MPPKPLAPDDEAAWSPIRKLWNIPDGLTYLNHGAFGYAPERLIARKTEIFRELCGNPMGIFSHELEARLLPVRDRMAAFAGAPRHDVILIENATYGINIIANSLKLHRGDEVLLTGHEYGAVFNIWRQACQDSGAELKTCPLPWPVASSDGLIDTIQTAFTPKTRLLVVSHITSGSGIRMPIEELCKAAREREILTCVDGPHAPAAVDLNLVELGCDFYSASCHKWLCGPLGTGFLYVRPEHQPAIKPPVISWGRLLPSQPEAWQDWFTWIGTRDLSSYLSLPVAIDVLEEIGVENFRRRSHFLVNRASQQIQQLTHRGPFVVRSDDFDNATFVPMLAMPIGVPTDEAFTLQRRLHLDFRIEVPVYALADQTFLRISAHAYNTPDDIDRLTAALAQVL